MYAYTAEHTWKRWAAHLSGSPQALLCVVSNEDVGEQARSALLSTAGVLGYGGAVAFATLKAGEDTLSERDLFQLVEGLDPIALVAADAESARALSVAYRADVPPLQASRVLGRTCTAFRSFDQMLAAPEAKQEAWALLKKLPRFGEEA